MIQRCPGGAAWAKPALRAAGIHRTSGFEFCHSFVIGHCHRFHQSLEATEKYVRLTSEMYPGLLSDVTNICKYAFPKADNHEAD